jgi:hypothetical protein
MKKISITLSFVLALVAFAMWVPEAEAYERYNDGCQNCHGSFMGHLPAVYPQKDLSFHPMTNTLCTEVQVI